MGKNVEAILFDMDGLLLDTEYLSERIWKEAKERFKLISDDKFIEKVIGPTFAQAKLVYYEEFGEEFPLEDYMKWRNKRENEIIQS